MNAKTTILTGDRPTGPLHLVTSSDRCASAWRCSRRITSTY